MKRQPYNLQVINVTKSGFVSVNENCNGFTATNIGDTDVTVNGMLLYAGDPVNKVLGDSRQVGGNEGEEYKGNLKIVFDATGPNLNLNLEIAQKIYVE